MKKLHIFFASIFITIALISCNENEILTDDGGSGGSLKSTGSNIASTPVSDGGIIPYIIPGKNKGGNRTCEEVEIAFNASFDLCGDKLDYNGDDNGNGSFDGEFPEGLNVTVDGNFISFEINGCITIEGENYKVGAVIVKGSNAANVYFYPDGTLSDGGLAAPGGSRMVSNLTFCFIECEEEEELVIAVKCYYFDGSSYNWGLSAGSKVFDVGWCGEWYLGVNEYPSTSSFDLHLFTSETKIGEVTVVNGTVTIDLNKGLMLVFSALYVGTLDDLLNNNLDSNGCPITNTIPPWMVNETYGNSQIFIII